MDGHVSNPTAVLPALEARGEAAPPPAPPRRLVTRAGASVGIAESEGRERIEVRDGEGRLVFELDPVTGRTVVTVPRGDLVLQAAGDVKIAAGGAVRCRGAEGIALEAGRGDQRSRLRLAAGLAELVAGRVETVADRLFEKARSVFRQVEDLHQLRAGRARTVVADGFHLKSGHAVLECDDEMKIDGKTIHLG